MPPGRGGCKAPTGKRGVHDATKHVEVTRSGRQTYSPRKNQYPLKDEEER
jgi:hypothetical protein